MNSCQLLHVQPRVCRHAFTSALAFNSRVDRWGSFWIILMAQSVQNEKWCNPQPDEALCPESQIWVVGQARTVQSPDASCLGLRMQQKLNAFFQMVISVWGSYNLAKTTCAALDSSGVSLLTHFCCFSNSCPLEIKTNLLKCATKACVRSRCVLSCLSRWNK